jgi:hypothetical protein
MVMMVVTEIRPFPFDRGTLRVYEHREWDALTGIGQLAQVLFLGDEDLMVLLAFYGDGSGEHGKGTFVVAGYITSTIHWFEVERLWCKELRAAPTIKYFKAAECLHLENEFEGWTREAADKKRDRLVDVVRRNGEYLTELSSTLRWDDYHSVMGNGAMKQAFYNPYFFCFHGIISLAIDCASEFKYKGRIAFVLDTESNANLDDDTQKQYEYARYTLPKEMADRMGSTTWDSDIKFPMLQIADLIAWSIRAEKEGLGSPVIRALRENISKAVTAEWNPSRVAQLVVDMDQLLGPKGFV